jgi:hypothetical protein
LVWSKLGNKMIGFLQTDQWDHRMSLHLELNMNEVTHTHGKKSEYYQESEWNLKIYKMISWIFLLEKTTWLNSLQLWNEWKRRDTELIEQRETGQIGRCRWSMLHKLNPSFLWWDESKHLLVLWNDWKRNSLELSFDE